MKGFLCILGAMIGLAVVTNNDSKSAPPQDTDPPPETASRTPQGQP